MTSWRQREASLGFGQSDARTQCKPAGPLMKFFFSRFAFTVLAFCPFIRSFSSSFFSIFVLIPYFVASSTHCVNLQTTQCFLSLSVAGIMAFLF